jgi:Na+/H+-dicarboxylate symporter
MFRWYFKTSLPLRVLISLILGVLAGVIFQEKVVCIKPLGDIFIRLLKMITVPIIVLTLISGASNIEPSRLGRIGAKIFSYYFIALLFATTLGLLAANFFKPGVGLNLQGSNHVELNHMQAPSLVDTIISIVPNNFFEVVTKGEILPIVFFCLLFGLGLAFVRDSKDKKIKACGDLIYQFFHGSTFVVFKMIHWILQYAPIGVFALIAVTIGTVGPKAIGPLAYLVLVTYIALFLQIVIFYGGTLTLVGINFIKFLRKTWEPFLMGFTTRTSEAVLPVSIETAQEKMGISESLAAFTLPIGAKFNMDGSTLYEGVCAIFIAQAIGLHLSFTQQMIVIFTAILATLGTAGVPSAAAIMLLFVLNSIGLTVEPGHPETLAYTMIFGIDALLDMGKTATNVLGDLTATTFVAKLENEIDLSKWND